MIGPSFAQEGAMKLRMHNRLKASDTTGNWRVRPWLAIGTEDNSYRKMSSITRDVIGLNM
jgi:hypothetical protein